MSLHHLRTDHNGFQDAHLLSSQLSVYNTQNPQMILQILSHSIGLDGCDGLFGIEEKSPSLNLGETDEQEQQQGYNKSYGAARNGNTKLCARGHWRPAEDAKLKELVAHYGPHNWNLIAETLHGRSGN